MPNLRDKTVRGDWSGAAASHIGFQTIGELPKITGYINLTGQSSTTTPRFNSTNVSGSALYNTESIKVGKYHTDSADGAGYNRIRFDASRSSPVYIRSDNIVIPNSLTMHWVIKY